jgi:hypothetical protein
MGEEKINVSRRNMMRKIYVKVEREEYREKVAINSNKKCFLNNRFINRSDRRKMEIVFEQNAQEGS